MEQSLSETSVENKGSLIKTFLSKCGEVLSKLFSKVDPHMWHQLYMVSSMCFGLPSSYSGIEIYGDSYSVNNRDAQSLTEGKIKEQSDLAYNSISPIVYEDKYIEETVLDPSVEHDVHNNYLEIKSSVNAVVQSN